MSTRLYRSISEPIREDLSYEERWHGLERALITCWEVGRNLREKDLQEIRKGADAAASIEERQRTPTERAEDGELPVLSWAGGVPGKLERGIKFGSLHYLAQWQGLRGEDLDIDVSAERKIICSRTGVHIIYTADARKYTGEIQPKRSDQNRPPGEMLTP